MKNIARIVERWPWYGFPLWLLLFLFGWRCRHYYSRGLCSHWTRCVHLDGHESEHMNCGDIHWRTGDRWEIRQ